ncbi:hypothetical protein ABDD95_05750 [Mucilaginibacter sp. PAMB04274]|uniref:hypothetical protein n=1 Tax=Mucilaginibacter sp. PAMB04274 TaxID=3138568 RepID=UPI0031F639CC
MKLLSYPVRPKLYYSPGLISLVLLPTVCLVWLKQHKAFEEKRIIDIVFFNPSFIVIYPNNVFPPKKKYTTINLTGNLEADKISLQYAQVLLSRWKAAKDDIQGVNFHFGNKSKYWAFVEAINVCKAIDLQLYMPYQNNMYAMWSFHPGHRDKKLQLPLCGGIGNFEPPPQRPTFYKMMLDKFGDYWLSGIVFMLMVSGTLLKLKSKSAKHKLTLQNID